ncbi:MAG: lipoprotein signal peptidase [Paludibacteraceae bacterium]|jgi:signal peptidase II|nr:lipoprotein signal peptidase [Paludibacteraceae bacterium]MDI9536329.1 lipoprotein signal peptidase [Bacteroidota bacterium]OQC33452.1 MAG: Lipoprotein signal peptidase [Bacteroidetes bacterium ADurb.Bin057]HHT61671.1 lipoprotein signal peptidase [Bacteroidales bacterium]MBP9039073.1 lipoprotein signal peptidase [Paludibacteraceae bacterium]
MSKKRWVYLVMGIILIADQVLKIFIKTSFTLGESVHVFDWFQIVFVENPGMAFGITLGSKLFLTLFRIVVIAFAIYYLYLLIRDKYKTSYIVCVALIVAGAIGNVIDSLFYGLIFSESTPFQVAELFPEAGGYAPFLMGKVVDMFYFPLFVIPDWVPWIGGDIFFSPVFNIADSAITVGIIILLLFFRQDFSLTLDKYTKHKKKN